MSEGKQNNNDAREANQAISGKSKDYSARYSSQADTEAELANQKIQQEFYGDQENNLLPFHVDSNNPPIKK